jgi:hypothetical protein
MLTLIFTELCQDATLPHSFRYLRNERRTRRALFFSPHFFLTRSDSFPFPTACLQIRTRALSLEAARLVHS